MDQTRPERRLRLFVAVAVPPSVRRAVDTVASALRPEAAQARWTEADDWHLTLVFLGPVHPARLEDIATALSTVAAGAQPLELALSGRAGTFGQRVLWAGFEDSLPLADLAGEVGEALEPLGFPREKRPLHPHLTLARAGRDTRIPRGIEARYHGPRLAWRVEELHLMRSELHRHGARYHIERRFPLAG